MTEGARPTGTYKTLAEQRESLAPAEQKCEKAQQTIGLCRGPTVVLVILRRVCWLAEAGPIPATAILALALGGVLVKLLSGVCWRAG